MPEAYQWVLVPGQKSPKSAVEWQALRVSGSDALAARASKKLRGDDSLITVMAGTTLRMDMDKIPLWRGNHVSIKQLAEDFAKYLYLPRVADSKVVVNAASYGLGRLTWEQETFAYADSFDEAAGRYVGLRPGENMSLPEILDDLERQLIQRAYDRTGGVKTETARLLGIKTSALYYKLEKYGIGTTAGRPSGKT